MPSARLTLSTDIDADRGRLFAFVLVANLYTGHEKAAGLLVALRVRDLPGNRIEWEDSKMAATYEVRFQTVPPEKREEYVKMYKQARAWWYCSSGRARSIISAGAARRRIRVFVAPSRAGGRSQAPAGTISPKQSSDFALSVPGCRRRAADLSIGPAAANRTFYHSPHDRNSLRGTRVVRRHFAQTLSVVQVPRAGGSNRQALPGSRGTRKVSEYHWLR